MMAPEKNESLTIIYGMKSIAAFYGVNDRKAFHLASQGLLAGVFKLGKTYACDTDVARKAIRARAGGQ